MISKLALKGNPQAFKFPRPMINSGNFEFSFSGLKTAVLYEIQKHKSLNSNLKSNLAASVQQAIVDVLISKTEKAIQRYKPKTIILGGGVAANALLRERFKQLAMTYHLSPIIPEFQYCTDNAAMIGLAAYYKIRNKKFNTKNFSPDPNLTLK